MAVRPAVTGLYQEMFCQFFMIFTATEVVIFIVRVV